MIEQTLTQHLRGATALAGLLATHGGHAAVFNQTAPPDVDAGWADGPQYPRVIFIEELQGDPERAAGGRLAVDIICQDSDEPFPETIEPILRGLVHGWFFQGDGLAAAAQWRETKPFVQPTDHTVGATVLFDLLAFPVLTTSPPDVVDRLNTWTTALGGIQVIPPLPAPAWKPTEGMSAVYWRIVGERPAGRIPDTNSTIWRTATVRGHIFSPDNKTALQIARELSAKLYQDKRLMKPGEAPIMVNRDNQADPGADPLRTGQISVEATYGVIVAFGTNQTFQHLTVGRS